MCHVKIVIEFDTVAQKGEITHSWIKTHLQALNLLHKVKIKELKTPKTKTIYGVEIRFQRPRDLTQAQIDVMMAMLRGMFAAWINPPITDPFSFGDSGGVAASGGLVLATVLPYVERTQVVCALDYASPDLEGSTTAVYLGATDEGNEELSHLTPNPNPALFTGAWIRFMSVGTDPFKDPAPVLDGPIVTIPKAAAITLKDADGVSLVLPARDKDIVLTPSPTNGLDPSESMQAYWIDEEGQLFLAQSSGDSLLTDLSLLSHEAAVATGRW